MKYLLTLFFCLFSVYIQAENYPYQSSILWVTQPDHDNWIYKTGEKANIEVSVFEYGIPLNNVEIEYAFGAEMLDKTNKGVITLKQGKANINIGTSKVPGFIDCEFTLKRGKQKYKQQRINEGIASP